MTARIAPAPVSMSGIGRDDRQPRSKPQHHDSAEQEANRRFHAARKKARAAAETDIDDRMPAATLFATTLLANDMRQQGKSLDAPLRHTEWVPTDSGLRLRDKTI